MIPLKLSLRNFLSYGAKVQEIDIGPYPLICFSGKNGHGKSALLDAVTWAIWGQARKIGTQAKPDINLLRLGQNAMMVSIDILCNGTHYRIKREFALTKSANHYASLEFGIIDDQETTVKNLTEKTIRSTQEAIDSALGLSFDTFVNTAFLRQGNANEFSKKSPKERKEILAHILQLETFEQLKKCAHERAKEYLQQINQQTHHKMLIEHQLAQYDHFHTTQTLLANELRALKSEEKNVNTKQKIVEQTIQSIIQEQLAIQFMLEQDRQLQTEQEKGQQQILELFDTWRKTQKQLKVLTPIDQQEKETLREKLRIMQKQQEECFALKEKFFQEQTKLTTYFHELHTNHEHVLKTEQLKLTTQQGELHKLSALLQKAKYTLQEQSSILSTLQEKHKKTITQLEQFNYTMECYQKLAKQYEKRILFYHRWVEYLNRIIQESTALTEKKKLNQQSNHPCCPLCEQALTIEHAQLLTAKFIQEEKSLFHRRKRLVTTLKQLKKLLIDQKQELKRLEEAIKKLEELKITEQTIQEQLKLLVQKKEHTELEVQDLQKSIAVLKQKITHTEQKYRSLREQKNFHEKNKTAEKYQAHVDTLKQRLAQHPYQAHVHQELLKKWQHIEQQEKVIVSRNEQIMLQQQRVFQLLTLKKRLKELKKLRLSFAKQHEVFGKLNTKKEDFLIQKSSCEQKQKSLQIVKEQLLQERAQANTKLEHLEAQKKELTLIEERLQSLQEEAHDYTTLSTAFSKDGIQALLIEDALPEIEQEANMLLAQLTNNQSHIMIESLRDLKKGGMKETLDIKISDALGIRPYELFSGGEAFRIDFALRIAISKLLARRAGTALQTLIIDEGFGSQDEEGISLLMDTIHKIQNEFAKVIIISHLPILKEQFPVHFMIHKTGQGSSVHVVRY